LLGLVVVINFRPAEHFQNHLLGLVVVINVRSAEHFQNHLQGLVVVLKQKRLMFKMAYNWNIDGIIQPN
jgi:hypothetical protein